MYVYDVTRRDSLNVLPQRHREIVQHFPDGVPPIILGADHSCSFRKASTWLTKRPCTCARGTSGNEGGPHRRQLRSKEKGSQRGEGPCNGPETERGGVDGDEQQGGRPERCATISASALAVPDSGGGRAVNELFERMLRESLEWADPFRLRVPVREEPSRWFVPTSLSATLLAGSFGNDHNDDGGGGGQSRSCVLQ